MTSARTAAAVTGTGWCSANGCSQPGIESTGTNTDEANTSGASIQAGVAHGQRDRREVLVVQQPQHVDEQARAVVGGEPDGRAVPLGLGAEAPGQQLADAGGADVVAHPELDHGAAELGLSAAGVSLAITRPPSTTAMRWASRSVSRRFSRPVRFGSMAAYWPARPMR